MSEKGMLAKNVNFVDEHNYIPLAKAILEVVGNLRLVGETGTGKTTLVHRLAEILDMPLFEIVLTRDVTKWDLLACDTLIKGSTETRKGIIMQWLENKKGILYIDGFNYAEPSIISLLESLADFRGSVWIPEIGQTFVRTEKHYLVISYNPSEKAGYCLTEDMMITTPSKFETIRLISKNNYVFNECNQKDKVTDTNTRNYKGKLYTVKAKSILPISSSDDHTFIVAERTRKIIKNPTWTHKKNTYEYQIVEKLAKDLKAYRKEDYGITSTTVDTLIFPKHKIETETQTPLDLAWLYGLFVADGSTTKNDKRRAIWCLGSHETDLIEKTKIILKENGYEHSTQEQANETRITVSDRKLRDFLRENFGTYAENKHVPQFIMDSTKKITKAFLEGYIDGDGFVDNKQTQIKTVSKNLILGLQRLYSKLDMLLSIQTIQPKNTKLTEGCKLQLQYLGRIPKSVKTTQDEQNFYLPIVKITTKDYDGTLYDITTEKHLIQVNNIVIHQSGTFIENIATIRRFEGLVIDYLSLIKERELIRTFSNDYDFSGKFAEIARKTRTLYKESKLRTPLTTGNLINYAKLYKNKMAEDDIITIAESLFPEEERKLFRSLFEDNSEINIDNLKKKPDEDDS